MTWPLVDVAVCWSAGPTVTPVQSDWCSVTGRTEGKLATQRGKQYELDQVQPGQMTVTLRNTDGALDPSNSSSPFAGFVLPYRLFRVRAQWPRTQNLLTADQATAWYATKGAGGAGSVLPPLVSPGSYPVTVINVYPTNEYSVALPASPTPGDLLSVGGFSVTPGAALSAQCLMSSGTAGLTGYVRLYWLNAAGTVLSSVSSASVALSGGGPVLVTVTGVAPANAAGCLLTFGCVNSPGSSTTLNVSNLQVEQAAAPTAWAQPGTWYPLFTGYVERWPQAWTSGGNYGTVTVTAVDIFALLAARGLSLSAYLEMLQLDPSFFYPLDAPAGSVAFADLTGNRAPMGQFTAGAVVTAGAQPQATGSGWLPSGAGQSCVQFANTDAIGAPPSQLAATLDLGATSPTAAVGPPNTSAFTRIIAFRNTGTAANQFTIWAAAAHANPLAVLGIGVEPLYLLEIDNGSAPAGHLKLNICLYSSGTLATEVVDLGFVADGGWHLFAMAMNAAGTSLGMYVDGTLTSTLSTGSIDMRPNLRGGAEQVGGWVIPSGGENGYGFTGQVAFLAELPYAATTAQMVNLYQAFRYGWATTGGHVETSGARYLRMLNWAGYTGPVSVDTGALATYGAAEDIAGGTSPTSLLTALQNVVNSEIGEHFIAADGTIDFRARTDRYNTTPSVTFGEQSGEVPYLNASMDYDPTRLANDVTATAQNSANGGVAASHRVVDPASVADYGTVTLQQTVNTVSPADLDGAAQYLLYQNSQPSQRLQALTVDVGANPAVWATLLALDLGAPVLVNRRPSNAPAISIGGFVEQIAWSMDGGNAAGWTAQVSSSFRHQFGVLDSATYGQLDSTMILGY